MRSSRFALSPLAAVRARRRPCISIGLTNSGTKPLEFRILGLKVERYRCRAASVNTFCDMTTL